MTVTVAVDRAAAFDVFTRETDLWWRKGFAYRVAGRHPGTLLFEPRQGGRLFETFETTSGPQTYEYGRIKVWQPPARLVFEWRNSNFERSEVTEVEVLFDEIESGNTRVTLHHRGWASLAPRPSRAPRPRRRRSQPHDRPLVGRSSSARCVSLPRSSRAATRRDLSHTLSCNVDC